MTLRAQGLTILGAGIALVAWGVGAAHPPLVLAGLIAMLFGVARARWLPLGTIRSQADAARAVRVARWANVVMPASVLAIVILTRSEGLLTLLLSLVLVADVAYYIWLARLGNR